MKYTNKLITVLLCLSVISARAASAWAGDEWMSKIALSELERSAENGEFDELAGKLKGAVLGRLSTGKVKDLSVMTDLIYVLRACEYGKVAMEMRFDEPEAAGDDTDPDNAAPARAPAAKAPAKGEFKDGKSLFKWLVANRILARVLFRGMQDVEDPAAALAVVAQLHAAGEKNLLAFNELTTAFATSRLAECYQEQPDPASLVESFKYYTTRKMRYDLKTMPYELSRFLTDTQLSIKERLWAYGRYARYPNPAKAYFDLQYDAAHAKDGIPKKISKLEFTLPNLRKVGGVCIEQAYYSSEVCKAVGIPAAIVNGQGGDEGHNVWTMCFVKKRGSRSAGWDSATGRYEEQKNFVGDVQHPAFGEKILDCDLMVEGSASLMPPTKREDADTAAALAVMASEVANAGELADLADLKALAALYKKRFGNSPVDIESLKAGIKIDMAVVEEFLGMALGFNFAHKPVWDFIIELRRDRDMLDVTHLGKYFDLLTSKTAKAYPDYSCEMVMRIVPCMPEHAGRLKIYQKAMRVYAARRDLQGRIMIACGDDCAEAEKPASALKFYQAAALKNVDLVGIVTEASEKAEKLLVSAGHTKAAITMYGKLFKIAKRPRKTAGVFAGQNSYFILGDRLATMLETAGMTKDAAKIRASIKQ